MNDENNALMFATEGGFIKTTLLSEFLSGRCPATGLIAIKLKDNDKLLSVKKVNITDKESTVINYTENGICNIYQVSIYFGVSLEAATNRGKWLGILKW